ncbi:YmaF family protein [Clostridium sp. WILCCON 0269]|uniref:YmaF family protein n=1 Tax=Candidatus Clostridium eludens TaxID=3381663 RepID=A0ABW8SLV0_9CLOT
MSCCNEVQAHDHEFLGSTMLAELEEDPHNHRFAGVSGPALRITRGHVHVIKARTDFYEDHFHEVTVTSGPQIDVGGGRHIHFVKATTTEADGHIHNLIFATLIEDPISEEA